MSDASDDKLADMHDRLTNTLLDILENGETVPLKNGGSVTIKPRAATLNVIRQFLKDNDIDGVPTEGSALDKLAQTAGDVLPFKPKKQA